MGRSANLQAALRIERSAGADLNSLPAREERPCQAARLGTDAGQVALRHHFASPDSRARAKVDHVVGRPHGVFVVLDHDHGVALVAEIEQAVQQLVVVTGMQPDRRFVENVQHPHQSAANLTGQSNALALAPRQRGCRAIKRQVVEPAAEQEAQPPADLLERLLGDLLRGGIEFEPLEESRRLGNGEPADTGQRQGDRRC